MTIVFGADYRAIEQSEALTAALGKFGDVRDVVKADPALSDYVEVAERVIETLSKTSDSRGVIICGTGIGICIVANKHTGISAARCVSVQDAVDCKVVNNSNVLCLSAKTPAEENVRIIEAFFATEFPRDPRRVQRLNKIVEIEVRNFKPSSETAHA